MNDQERQLLDFRNMIRDLAQEKEKLERSFLDMRRELQQVPQVPAGRAGGAGAGAGSGGGQLTGSGASGPLGPAGSGMSGAPLGPAGGRQIPAAPAGVRGSASNSIPGGQSADPADRNQAQAMLNNFGVFHPAGTVGHPKVEQSAGRRQQPERRNAPKTTSMGFRKEARRPAGQRPPSPTRSGSQFDDAGAAMRNQPLEPNGGPWQPSEANFPYAPAQGPPPGGYAGGGPLPMQGPPQPGPQGPPPMPPGFPGPPGQPPGMPPGPPFGFQGGAAGSYGPPVGMPPIAGPPPYSPWGAFGGSPFM